MRYLSKIIFVESAHIPYAEIRLDGNVHFIGTQGVGKSTILRAILFFYNADKLRLGIPKEKKNFDEFYLTHDYSYIIYEVQHDESKYMAVAYRSRRTAFRFIDAPYKREYFIGADNTPYSDWSQIRAQVNADGHKVSRIVEKYEEFKDIIFGNKHNVPSEFHKFAISESSKYQNIPRTIQNIFLNSKLDADFIKDTIIRSMNDEDVELKLDFYRTQVAQFEQQYRDIELWSKKNKNGVVPVRSQADKVISNYHNVRFSQAQITELCKELNYAEQRDREELLPAREELNRLNSELERFSRLLKEEEKKFSDEKQKLDRQIGVFQDKLNQIKKKRQEYEILNIGNIVARYEKKNEVESALIREQEVRTSLTKEYDSITEKYNQLRKRAKEALDEICNEIEKAWINYCSEVNAKSEKLLNVCNEKKKALNVQYEEIISIIEERLESIKNEIISVNTQITKTQYAHPNENKIENCKQELQILKDQQTEYEHKKTDTKNKKESLIKESEVKIKDIKGLHQKEIEGYESQKNNLQIQVNEIEELLKHYSGSFYEWLEANRPGWQHNIGKIADEENILYNTELNPSIAPNNGMGDSLFGVNIDLKDVVSKVRKPDELNESKKQLEEQINQLNQNISSSRQHEQEEIKSVQTDYGKKVSKLTADLSGIENLLWVLPTSIKNQQNEIERLKKEEDEWREAELNRLNKQLDEFHHNKGDIEDELKKKKSERDRKIKEADKAYDDSKHELERERKEEEKNKESKKDIHQKEYDNKIAEYKLQEQSALAEKGVDTKQLAVVDAEIERLKLELKFINDNAKHYFSYIKDTEELFSHEDEFHQQKQSLNDKLNGLNSQFEVRRDRLNRQKSEASQKVNLQTNKIEKLNDFLSETDKYRTVDSSCPEQLATVGQKNTSREGSEILGELKSTVYSAKEKIDTFRQAVNNFKSNFSSKNTFHFKVELSCDSDYMEFAENVDEFITQNKIVEYQNRVSDHYSSILKRISKEVSDIEKHDSEIDTVIHEINNDFNEKRKYATVIKAIELQSRPSSDPLMQLLNKINKFVEDNQYNLGEEQNLFTDMDSKNEIRDQIVDYLFRLVKLLNDEPHRERLTLSDIFRLEFRIKENDNDTGWIEKISNVGSDGTDVLVKAMVNIMLISVFKKKVSRRFGDFKLHCMMDEIGKLHPSNVQGILNFANVRDIYLLNSSPTTYNVSDYKYTYLLTKNGKSDTQIVPLISIK